MTKEERRGRKRRQRRISHLIEIGLVLFIFGSGALLGWHLGAAHAAEPQLPAERMPPAVIPESEKTPLAEIALDPKMQGVMRAMCEKYEVPYALALAIAEQESRFDPDAVSATNDYGLMQINKVNFGWLQDLGIDPMTYEGNIEAGVYMISQHLHNFKEPELALMAYNSGSKGAQRLWDAGTFQTEYSQKVMAAFAYWTSVLED